ncbi:recombinase family protein [Parerythrobacter aestuarii]|uniref:recombinase family protein n=1 Tax=Parerythrobacter aestuarii TaxID=3020909 RepID=UPI0024DE1401|nr:recombinase family protein [Parerythrobacter aestuarii]
MAYIRVSTAKQGEGVSLEAQREAIEAFASRNHLSVVQWFEEKETAAKRGRPVFNEVVRLLRRGKADGLIVHKIDRSARNFADWAKIGDLADAGVSIHFASESLDFTSRGGRLAADVQAVVAADYIRNLREESIKGLNGRLKQGLYPFRAPIGYLDNGRGKPKTLDPERAPLVKRAFELYATRSHSLRTLRAELNRQGLTGRNGRALTMNGLMTMLNNPFYTGVIHIKRTGRTYKGIHERLITTKLFERVQEIKSGKSGPKVTRHNHIYQGLFRCAHCNGAMVPELQKGRVYYRCKTVPCITRTIREDQLEIAIETRLTGLQLTGQDLKRFRRKIEAWQTDKKHEPVERSLQLRRAKLAERIDRLIDAHIDGRIGSEDFSKRRRSLALEEEVLDQEQREMRDLASAAVRLRTLAELASSVVSSHRLGNGPERRQLLEIVSPNWRVSGRNVDLEPYDWLLDLKSEAGVPFGDSDRSIRRILAGVPSGEPSRDRDRTFGALLLSYRRIMRAFGCEPMTHRSKEIPRDDKGRFIR